jgi:DNA-binding NarL/FixJ family response regulator
MVYQPDDGKGTIRVIVADTQAIFRAGLRKIFALEDDIRVVARPRVSTRPSQPSRNSPLTL